MHCSPIEGEAIFRANIKEGSPCLESLFPFDPGFRAARNRGDASGIFFQETGGNFQDVDLIVFEIFDRSNLDVVTLEEIGGDDVAAVGQIELGGQCRDQMFGYYLEGTLSFTELDTKNNGRVAGTLTEGSIRNSKTGEIVGSEFEGEFDFPVFAGQPFEEFTTN